MKAVVEFFRKVFGRKRPPAPAPAPAPVPVEPTWTFQTDFTRHTALPVGWFASTWTAPGASTTNGVNHRGHWDANNVSFSEQGMCLRLDQKNLFGEIVSTGAEVATERLFGYGTFEWEAKASATPDGKPVSGSITGLFIYRNEATTEIDFEVEGNERHRLTQCTSWVHESQPNQTTPVTPPADNHLPHQQFCTYRAVWTPGKIEYYRDGVLIATHTKVVPSQQAVVMMNHWGTNSPNWGGMATLETPRYVYIKSFKYAPLV